MEINKFKPQKALHLYLELEKKRTKIADDEFMIFEKYDGWYGSKRVDVDADFIHSIFSRNMRVIPSVLSLSARMYRMEALNNITLQGQLIFEILVEGQPLFSDLNGTLNRTKGNCTAEGAYLMVHDFVPDDNHDMPAFERYALARQYVETLRHDRVKLATLYAFGGHNLIQQVAEKVWARKNKNISKEGAIGKIAKAPYEMGKKNKSIIKVKCEVTLDMVVVGWEAGEVGSKYETTLGKLIVEQASGKRHSVSGMSDDDRDAWYNDFGLINKQVVEIDAMQVLPNGSLREGRYKCIRHDKDVSEID